MTKVVVLGSSGFLGRNLTARLTAISDLQVTGVDVDTLEDERDEALAVADVIFHLAGVNRPSDPGEFARVNRDFTVNLCRSLQLHARAPKIIFTSSIQAALDNPYGVSKREAEDVLLRFAAQSGATVRIYRLKNLFGKWSRPNYNSVVATFCHNIANDLPIQISDPNHAVELVYVDDVIDAFVGELGETTSAGACHVDCSAIPSHTITLGELARTIQSFRELRETLLAPDLSGPLNRELYGTYLSYVPDAGLETRLQIKRDQRGSLAEFLKSRTAGQIFVSRTLPGIVRGNHYHHTKTEKFFVVEGEGLLRMRQINSLQIVEYHLSGKDYQVVDIPPGYTHSIENIGKGEMVTIFWADEIFDPQRPDTYFLPVLNTADRPALVTA